jgi:hypothetical protein
MPTRSSWLIALSILPTSLLIFYLLDPAILKKSAMFPTVVVDWSISFHSSISFCILYLTLILVIHVFQIVLSSWRLTLLIFCKSLLSLITFLVSMWAFSEIIASPVFFWYVLVCYLVIPLLLTYLNLFKNEILIDKDIFVLFIVESCFLIYSDSLSKLVYLSYGHSKW